MSYEVSFNDIYCYEAKDGKEITRTRISVTVEKGKKGKITIGLYSYDSYSGSIRNLPPEGWEGLKEFVDRLVEEAKRWRPMKFEKDCGVK